MNRVELDARLVEKAPLRYTPAGVAVLDVRLAHEAQVTEAGSARRVAFEVAAVAMGDTAFMLGHVAVGAQVSVHGFLAPARKGAARLVLHVQGMGPGTRN